MEQRRAVELASLTAAATTLIVGIGTLTATGTLGRVQRNEGGPFTVAIAAVIVGAALVFVAGFLRAGTDTLTKRQIPKKLWRFAVAHMRVLGALVTALGVLGGFAVAVRTADDVEQPSVSLAFDERTGAVRAVASVSNLNSDKHLAVLVDGLRSSADGTLVTRLAILGRAFVGPDSDGKATVDLDVQVPPGRFDAVGVVAFTDGSPPPCGVDPHEQDGRDRNDGRDNRDNRDRKDDDRQGTGCAVLQLPPAPNAPDLRATWRRRSVHLEVAAAGRDASEFVTMRLVGVRGGKPVLLHRATVPAAASTEHAIDIPVGAKFRVICAHATTLARDHAIERVACPVHHSRAGVATIELRAPFVEGAWR